MFDIILLYLEPAPVVPCLPLHLDSAYRFQEAGQVNRSSFEFSTAGRAHTSQRFGRVSHSSI